MRVYYNNDTHTHTHIHTHTGTGTHTHTHTPGGRSRRPASAHPPTQPQRSSHCKSGLRQHLCFCTRSCVSICTLVLANLDTRETPALPTPLTARDSNIMPNVVAIIESMPPSTVNPIQPMMPDPKLSASATTSCMHLKEQRQPKIKGGKVTIMCVRLCLLPPIRAWSSPKRVRKWSSDKVANDVECEVYGVSSLLVSAVAPRICFHHFGTPRDWAEREHARHKPRYTAI